MAWIVTVKELLLLCVSVPLKLTVPVLAGLPDARTLTVTLTVCVVAEGTLLIEQLTLPAVFGAGPLQATEPALAEMNWSVVGREAVKLTEPAGCEPAFLIDQV